MGFVYQKAGLADLELLVQTRLTTLRAANLLPDSAELREVERHSHAYYRQALENGLHTAYLAFDGADCVATGGASYFQVMPTVHNPSGWKAYLMNLYTAPPYRRRGVALELLRLLVADAPARGIRSISLEATGMGRPLYEAFGFVPMEYEMELPERFFDRYRPEPAPGIR